VIFILGWLSCGNYCGGFSGRVRLQECDDLVEPVSLLLVRDLCGELYYPQISPLLASLHETGRKSHRFQAAERPTDHVLLIAHPPKVARA
jgi:hypothetical protein